ncbi:hypothetical protein LILAB_29560 [Corallococcus macrosporus]|uniref:Uncharacterized protein n=1 Tax=Myxococcus fulvus (strain ATCC BAA-855 / HW-1) TaxID=483219 RepID=F8CMY7_MYXFH|nr:hypothetical protein LILAB_29560 [Corallococcus macrosporus]
MTIARGVAGIIFILILMDVQRGAVRGRDVIVVWSWCQGFMVGSSLDS